MVVGVSSSKLVKGYRFLEKSNIGIDIYAPSNHLITLSDGKEFETPFCNSFAAPAVTGQICKLCEMDSIDKL